MTRCSGPHPDPRGALAACPPPAAPRRGIALPDGTRPVEVAAALAALREALPGDPVAVVGLGLHRAMRREELWPSPFDLRQHDPDDCRTLPAVPGPAGPIPGGLSRQFDGCGAILSVGVVELHQYAGFSGGHKGVAVGCGARATLDALHHRDAVCAPGVEIGRLDGNPFRAAVDRLGAAAGCDHALVQSARGWYAGDPAEVVRRAAADLECRIPVPRRYAAAVLSVPPRKAVNFYQASRAATYVGLCADPPLLPGATLYLDAPCPEGVGEGSGEAAFADVLRRTPPPWDSLLTGPAPVGAGTQRAIMLALLCRRYRLVCCSALRPDALRALGLEATDRPAREIAPPDSLIVAEPFARLPVLCPEVTSG